MTSCWGAEWQRKYSVAVTAHSTYLPDQSDEEEDRYVFAYTIRITNNGNVPAQLVQQEQVDLHHVQADELWVKRVGGRVWMALALALEALR